MSCQYQQLVRSKEVSMKGANLLSDAATPSKPFALVVIGKKKQ
jgi:hypothetical protein